MNVVGLVGSVLRAPRRDTDRAPFYANKPGVRTFRLSFATADVAKIEEGLGRLGKAL
jgi:DNA-binding transcriptional MocR family regulator